MKTWKTLGSKLSVVAICALGAGFPSSGARATSPTGPGNNAKSPRPIAWSELGAKAGGHYHGEGLSIVGSERGALLRCVFQKLEGHAAAEALWLSSTLPDGRNDRFRVVTCGVGK